MVFVTGEHVLQADVIFVIEATAVNGAYINDLKTNYIIPTLEHFSQGNMDEINYISEHANCLYGIVLYFANDCLPGPSSDTIGPFSSPGKVIAALDRLELIGGKGEYHANIAEGFATALACFEELQEKRGASSVVQKHCILVCNSPPYLLPVMETLTYSGKTAEQLAGILQEKGINLSILSPRKIPNLYKLFEKAGGDLNASQTKNYAKDPRHLVLLKGYCLKERPISPVPGTANPQTTLPPSTLPITSLPSPLGANDSPIQGISQLPTQSIAPGMVNMVGAARGGGLMGNTQFSNQPMQGPPGYHNPGAAMANRPPQRWPPMMPPAQRQPYMQGQQTNTTQGSALIAQLTQPPSSMQAAGVSQFGPMGSNSPLGAQQQQPQNPIRMGGLLGNQQPQPGVQTSLPQTVAGLQQTSNPSQVTTANQAITSQAQGTGQTAQPMTTSRERHNIWQGLLEWIEKPKNPADPQKITKHVPCTVSANSKDGEPELKADGWPSKLIMQLMPKHLIGNIGGAYLKNSKSVLFHPQNCEALESLTRVMNSGFAGCVHFTSVPNPACDIKVLILLYTAEKRAYLGFIPNDQAAFVERLRKVIQQQKSSQILRQQGTGGPTLNPQTGGPVQMGAGPSQLPTSSTPSQNPQQGMMISQTNTLAMGGGQITQNVVTSSGQPTSGIGVLGQNVSNAPGGSMQPRLRMQNIPQAAGQLNQPGNNSGIMAPGMMGAPVQRAPFENQLQVERQQNLEKINQLKQTLEAAQQQEQQYKSQLERISHMKTNQIQEALTLAQQQEMQFKMLDQQRLQQASQQAATAQQQQRMMRPTTMSNNPGLRHLLQQQPPFNRQQMMGMQQMPGNPQRPQMGQQMPSGGTNPQVSYDEVPNFDFM